MKKILIAIIVVFGLAFLAVNCYFTVKAGYFACTETFGRVSSRSYSNGLWSRIPFVEKVYPYPVRQQLDSFAVNCRLADTQMIKINGAFTYNLVGDSVHRLHLVVGENYKKVLIDPLIDGTINRVIGKHSVDFIISQQEMVVEAISYIITDRFKLLSVVELQDLQLFNPEFPQLVEDAIVNLAVAKIETEKAKETAQQMIEKAKAEGIALELKSTALANPLIVQYEIAKAMGKWKGDIPNTLMIGQGVLPVISSKK